MEETKEKLKMEYINWIWKEKEYTATEEEIAEWWLDKLDTYAQEKIDLMFSQEANRNKGMIKVRGGNGVGFIKKEELDKLN